MLTVNRVTPSHLGSGKTYQSIGNAAKMSACRRLARTDSLSRLARGLPACFYLVYSNAFKFRGRIDVVLAIVEREAAPPARTPAPAFYLN